MEQRKNCPICGYLILAGEFIEPVSPPRHVVCPTELRYAKAMAGEVMRLRERLTRIEREASHA
jgi:hypothetical protein